MIRPDETPKPWYKETAQALVAGIVAENAYDRLPILADALEEEGCDSYALLQIFRTESAVELIRQSGCLDRLASGVLSWFEASVAFEFFLHLAAEFFNYRHDKPEYEIAGEHPLKWVLGTLTSYLDTGDRFRCNGYNNPYPDLARLWRHYTLLTGRNATAKPGEGDLYDGEWLGEPFDDENGRDYYGENPYSCSC